MCNIADAIRICALRQSAVILFGAAGIADAIRICALRQSLLLMNTAMLLKMQSAFVR